MIIIRHAAIPDPLITLSLFSAVLFESPAFFYESIADVLHSSAYIKPLSSKIFFKLFFPLCTRFVICCSLLPRNPSCFSITHSFQTNQIQYFSILCLQIRHSFINMLLPLRLQKFCIHQFFARQLKIHLI